MLQRVVRALRRGKATEMRVVARETSSGQQVACAGCGRLAWILGSHSESESGSSKVEDAL